MMVVRGTVVHECEEGVFAKPENGDFYRLACNMGRGVIGGFTRSSPMAAC